MKLSDIKCTAFTGYLVTIDDGIGGQRKYLNYFEPVIEPIEDEGRPILQGYNYRTSSSRRNARLFQAQEIHDIIFFIACHGYKVSIEIAEEGR